MQSGPILGQHTCSVIILAALTALFPAPGASPAGAFQGAIAGQAPSQEIAIRAGHMFDSIQGRMLDNQVILIQGSRIAQAGPAAIVPIPPGAQMIDLSQAWVLPGLIDGHEHLFLTGEADGRYADQLLKESWQYRTIEAIVNAKRDLEAGFTTERDCGTEGAMYSDVDVKKAIDKGLVPGPRMFVATRDFSTTGSYPLLGYSPEVTVPVGVQVLDGPWEARKAVREEVEYGADFIKFYSTGASYFKDGKLVSVPTFTLRRRRPSSMKRIASGKKRPATPTAAKGSKTALMPARIRLSTDLI